MPPKKPNGTRIVYSYESFACPGCRRAKIDHYAKGYCYTCYVRVRRQNKKKAAEAAS